MLIEALGDRPPGILDSDLALLAGYKTKRINEVVRRSTYVGARCPIRYRLTPGEWVALKTACATDLHRAKLRFRAGRPYVYTFEGACLVMSRLRLNLSPDKKCLLLGLFAQDDLAIIDYGEGRMEECIINRLETTLGGLVTIRRHYPVRTTRGLCLIDAYLEDPNVAIEIDEAGHRRSASADSDRERAIRGVLGCEFIRITESTDFDACLNRILRKVVAS
jgi:very-short-patch-repair endonuclease